MNTAEVITLRGGVPVALDALRLALDLEGRGFHIRAEPDGTLIIRPRSSLTADDLAAIKNHRDDLAILAAYEAPQL